MPAASAKLCPKCRQIYRAKACPTCYRPWSAKPASWAHGSYNQREWELFRQDWLAHHPLCMDCGQPATVVCHKPGIDYSVDRCNPDAIEGQRCADCDAIETARQGAAARWGTLGG